MSWVTEKGGIRTDVHDDALPLPQSWQQRAGEPPRRGEIDLDDLMPVTGIGVGQHAFFENSSTVHQDIDLTCGMHETIVRGAIEKVRTDGMDYATRGSGKIGCSLFGGALISAVDDNLGAFAEERHSSRMADPPVEPVIKTLRPEKLPLIS